MVWVPIFPQKWARLVKETHDSVPEVARKVISDRFAIKSAFVFHSIFITNKKSEVFHSTQAYFCV